MERAWDLGLVGIVEADSWAQERGRFAAEAVEVVRLPSHCLAQQAQH